MLELDTWLAGFLRELDACFGARVCFAGLQGSHARGEAREDSDLDLVVVLDRLDAADIAAYGALLDRLPQRKLACGFLAGRAELARWEASDLFTFAHDTRPLRGSLAALLPPLAAADLDRAILAGACNIYHGCVHNMLHERSEARLRELYKAAAFVVQAACCRRTGRYTARHSALLDVAEGADREVLRAHLRLRAGGQADFAPLSEALFRWAQARIAEGRPPFPR